MAQKLLAADCQALTWHTTQMPKSKINFYDIFAEKWFGFCRATQESLELKEAQVRYELDQLTKNLQESLDERDRAHSERIRALEQVKNIS